ncbi:MAG: hypothetical protein NUK65_02600 [Firmicutes bacterium]|nr:hypothetical protein [Bacillota bacterium]
MTIIHSCSPTVPVEIVAYQALQHDVGRISTGALMNRTGLYPDCARKIVQSYMKELANQGIYGDEALQHIREQFELAEEKKKSIIQKDKDEFNLSFVNDKHTVIEEIRNLRSNTNKQQLIDFLDSSLDTIVTCIQQVDLDEIIREFPRSKKNLFVNNKVLVIKDFGKTREKKKGKEMLHYHLVLQVQANHSVYLELQVKEKVLQVLPCI